MLETLWYALLLLVQCVQVDPALHDKQLVLDVYIESKLAYSLEHRGALSSGYFFDTLSQKRMGDFEISRRASRMFTVQPAIAVEDVSDGATGNKDVAAEEVPMPSPFFLDLAPAIRLMASFTDKPAQNFPFVVKAEEGEAEKTKAPAAKPAAKTASASPSTVANTDKSPKDTEKATEETFMRVYDQGSHWVLTADFSGFIIVARFR